MRNIHLMVIYTVLVATVSENDESLILHYQKLLQEYSRNISNYKFPKDNSDFFTGLKDNAVHDYGSFDFIIIGAGSSGTAITNRLSEISDWRILLIEAGGEEDDISDIPGAFTLLQGSRMNWGYLTTPQSTCCFGMKNKQCVHPRGKVIGGSSTINALMYVRGNLKDYDRWEKLGNPGWNYKSVLPYFIKSENSQIYSDDYHGNDGPLGVDYPTPPSKLLRAFIAGNEELGRKYVDYNGRYQLGFSRTQLNIKKGRRVSGGRAYIRPILNRKNLNISTNSLVTRLIIKPLKPLKVDGVEFIKNGLRYRARATKEYIISAGAFNSPQILQVSGIGPSKGLRKLNISVVHNLPAVGKNLKDHPVFLGLTFHTNYTQDDVSTEQLIRDYLNGEGPLTSAGPTYGIGFIETKNVPNNVPDIEYLFLPPVSFTGYPNVIHNFNDDLKQQYQSKVNATSDITIYLVLLHPKSSGKVTLKSNDPRDFPEIDINYFSDRESHDVETLYRGIRFIQKLMNTESFKQLKATQYTLHTDCDNLGIDTREYWYCYIRTMTSTLYHPVGTTRMGRRVKNSVVNNKLLVHGIGNLRIADAGVMPSTLSGHTNAAAFMIGERVSDFIKDEYGRL